MKKFKQINNFHLLFGFIMKNKINDKKRQDQISKISNKKSCIEKFHTVNKTPLDQELSKMKKINK